MTQRAALIRECRHWVREALRASGMRGAWDIHLNFGRRNDTSPYACAISQPQYWRATLYFDFENPKFLEWERKPFGVRNLVLHELGHVWWSPYSKSARAFAKAAGGKAAAHVLEDLEDVQMKAWEQMPCWMSMKPYKPLRP